MSHENDDAEKNSQIHENISGAAVRYLWVDDLRLPPDGWDWAKTYSAAISLIGQHNYHTISLDHDLADFHNETMNHGGEIEYDAPRGRQEKTGYHVALWMVENQRYPLQVNVHTMNPVGGQNIMKLLQSYHPSGPGAIRRVSPC